MSEQPINRIAVSETETAEAIGVSVSFLRKDRITARRIPFYKLGSRVVYNLDRVREALAGFEEGGVFMKHSRARRVST